MRFMATMFCAKCAEAHRPKIRQNFLHFTDNGNTLEEYDHTDTHEYGMTPHSINVQSETDDEVTFASLCMMDDCGIKIFRTKDGEIIYYNNKNKPVVFNEGRCYQFDADKNVIPYSGAIHFRAVVLSEHKESTISKANFNALLKMKI